MSRKNKRQQPRKPQRGPAGRAQPSRPTGTAPLPPTRPSGGGPDVPSAAAAGSGAPSQAARPLPRPLPRGPRGRMQQGPLPTGDAAIPLERVPYFRSDLRRIAITAALMLVLLIAGSIVLRNVLQA